ncbi:MAG TPA: DUF4091 domain-containing protein [Labilithrix sp.]|nr:DUF4091 domain-containing protein [Labilithrix sp.]
MRAPLLALLLALALPRVAMAAPIVWAIDDGEKIKQDAAPAALASGAGNPVWSPGQPVRLFAMKNETVAFQIVVAADASRLEGVTVDLDALASANARIANAPGATDPTRYVGRPIERFVEHFFDVPRPSGGKVAGESLAWAPGSGPAPGRWTGRLPDALIPVEVAPAWSPYPLAIAPHTNGIVWIDVTVGKSQPPGLYKGPLVVKAGGAVIASLPVELEVADVTLPERPVRTMLYYARSALDRRMGAAGAAAEQHLLRLFHRHRLSPMHGAMTAEEVARQLAVLDGSFYTAKSGYEGPLEGVGDGVLSLGTYGGFGAPDASKLVAVEAIADLLAQKSLFATTDTFVYAIDEDCSSPHGATWKSLLAGSANANVKKVRVAWTCSTDATKQPVDIPIQAATFDAKKTAQARAKGKEVWAYNGRMPQTGSSLTDTPAISLRVNGWLSGMFDIGRWFIWETTFWYDDNRGGHGPYDPFVTAETFHNADGDTSMGDGVLVYPGKQVDMFTSHSVGMDGVIASIRLKNWRRGIEDAGYFQLAHAADPKKAEAIARALLPAVLSAAKDGQPASWSDAGKPYFEARKALLALVPRGTDGGPGVGAKPSTPGPSMDARATASGCRGCNQTGAGGFAILLAVLLRRKRPPAATTPRVRAGA